MYGIYTNLFSARGYRAGNKFSRLSVDPGLGRDGGERNLQSWMWVSDPAGPLRSIIDNAMLGGTNTELPDTHTTT
jgi:hypothetical protein